MSIKLCLVGAYVCLRSNEISDLTYTQHSNINAKYSIPFNFIDIDRMTILNGFPLRMQVNKKKMKNHAPFQFKIFCSNTLSTNRRRRYQF